MPKSEIFALISDISSTLAISRQISVDYRDIPLMKVAGQFKSYVAKDNSIWYDTVTCPDTELVSWEETPSPEPEHAPSESNKCQEIAQCVDGLADSASCFLESSKMNVFLAFIQDLVDFFPTQRKPL